MKAYECLLILAPETAPDAHKKQLEVFEELVKKQGGAIKGKNEWGRRPIAYPLKKNREGFFVIYDFEVDTLAIAEMNRLLTLDMGVLKFMITVKKPESARDKKKKTRVPHSVRPDHAGVA